MQEGGDCKLDTRYVMMVWYSCGQRPPAGAMPCDYVLQTCKARREEVKQPAPRLQEGLSTLVRLDSLNLRIWR